MRENTDHLNNLRIAANQNIKEKKFWLREFAGEFEKTCFPLDFNKESNGKLRQDVLNYTFEDEQFSSLQRASQNNDHALHIILLTGLIVLIHKYTGSQDIIIGMPIFETDVGINFVNTVLAVRNQIDARMTFKELTNRVKQKILEVLDNQNYPIEILLEELKLPVEFNDFPLSDVGILVENIQNIEHVENINFNMIFSFYRVNNSINGKIHYNPLRYEKITAEKTIKRYTRLMQHILGKTDLPIADIDILSDEDRDEIFTALCYKSVRFPEEQTVHQLFEFQARKNPHHTALIFQDECLTYSKLNERANKMARLLVKYGVGPNTIVGLLLEPSLEMVSGVLAVLKAGGAYLPLDPQTPSKRILSILDDSQVPILLSHEELYHHSFWALQTNRVHKLNVSLTAPRLPIQDFNLLPIPDRSLVDYETYNRYIGQATVQNSVSLQATRGCPYKCIYCHKIWPKSHHIRSAENIFKEVKLYYDMGVRRFAFIDDIFNLRRENSMKFFQLVVKEGMNIHLFFPNGVRGDILTKEYIDLMIEAGTIDLAFALETASPRLQRLIGKNLDLQRFRENIEYFCKQYPQVILELFTMHGFPSETEEEALMTLDFIKSLKWVDFPYVFILKIFPNTDMAKLALANGIPQHAIDASENCAYHELPETLPFDKSFTLKYQASFFKEYFLSKERLLSVLPNQMKVLTEIEIVQKYNSYLPTTIYDFSGLLEFFEITEAQLEGMTCEPESSFFTPDLNEKLKTHFQPEKSAKDALKILLLDLSLFFGSSRDLFYDVIEPPLGPMYLITYLKQKFGDRIEGKIAKSRIDFDSYPELKALLYEFKPDVIGIRSLSYYKEFFHKTLSLIRQWGVNVPVITGGPYATSSYSSILQDRNVDIVVLGEGEITFAELIERILENEKKLPDVDMLKEINGIAFIADGAGQKGEVCREILMLDTLEDEIALESDRNLNQVNNPQDLLYVIYTSGSTGKPKGVMINHRNVVRLLFNDSFLFDFNMHDIWTMFHSYSFDFSVWELYGALLYGGRLIIIRREVAQDTETFYHILKKENVTVLNQTPSAFDNLMNFELDDDDRELKLRYIIFGGEALVLDRLKKWKEVYPHTMLINMYGITETTVHVTYKHVTVDDITIGISNIGKPLPTLAVIIMDSQLKLMPSGIPGELCVLGDGLGRGYLNSPELSHGKFVYGTIMPNERFYRSGDLARLKNNMDLEYLGRIDQQVKIRGFRIELGEIENQLIEYHGIKEAIVLERLTLGGDNYLCGYLVRENSGSSSEFELTKFRDFLSHRLPNYMIPLHFVLLESIPLTRNGKVDRKALMEFEDWIREGSEQPPRHDTDRKLIELWSEVLGVEKRYIGINSDFFNLGGHSLNATILNTKIHKVFRVKVPLNEIFERPVLKSLSDFILTSRSEEFIPIRPTPLKDYYPLSSAQKRLYVLFQMDPGDTSYNIPLINILEGEINREKLNEAVYKVIMRHESLRTFFQVVGDEPMQRVKVLMDFKAEYCEEKKDRVDRIIRRFLLPFDLGSAPLLRVGLIKTEKWQYVLIINMHHIVADGVSGGLILEDMADFYNGKSLQPLKLQYRDYSEWQNRENAQLMMNKQERFWLREYEKKIPKLNLRKDFPRTSLRNFEGEHLFFEIGPEESSQLKRLAKRVDASLFMIILTIYYALLFKLSGDEDIVVGAPISGRRHADLHKIAGMFVNTLALRNYPSGKKRFKDFLVEVRRRTLEAFENQDFQFEKLVEKVAVKRDSRINPIFDVGFDFHNMNIPKFEMPGLQIKPYPYKVKISKFDLQLVCLSVENELKLFFEYCTSLFRVDTIRKFIEHFKTIVSVVVDNPEIKLSKISFTPETDKFEIMSQFNVNLEEE